MLAILRSERGVRAVNLFIKKTVNELELGGRSKDLYWLEATYYAEAEIPTVKISPDQLHPIVSANLAICVTRARPPLDVSPKQLSLALTYMEDKIFTSAPVSWERDLWERFGLLPQFQEWIFHYGVFHRRLKVDLTTTLARDTIHKPEKVNHAAEFSGRFLQSL